MTEKVNTKDKAIEAFESNPKFRDFLAKFADGDDTEQVGKRHEVFEQKAEVLKKLVTLYQTNLEKELGFKLEKGEIAMIEASIEASAVAQPDKILDLAQTIEQFEKGPQEIAELEKQLARTPGVSEIREKIERLNAESVGKGAEKEETAQRLAEKKKSLLHDLTFGLSSRGDAKALVSLEKELAEINDEVTKAEDALRARESADTTIQEAKNRFDFMRAGIFQDSEIAREVFGAVKDRIQTRLEKVSNLDSVPEGKRGDALIEAKRFAERMQKASLDGVFGNYFDALDYNEGGLFDLLEEGVSAQVEVELTKIISETSLTNSPVATLSKSIVKFFEKTAIGKEVDSKKTPEERKEYLTAILEKVRGTITGGDNADKIRRMTINLLIERVQKSN